MTDIKTYIEGHAGRITLTRAQALNALSHEMCIAIEDALDAWRDDPAVALVILDAEGERAFCAGGDIAAVYHAGMRGDVTSTAAFWTEEYRMNAKVAEFPKPVISFMQGYVMGGGVGIGCHGAHRVVCETTQIAMPECGIGLVPDVGGSMLLAQAPGALGEYYGLTGERMKSGDAIYCGFADYYIPFADWRALIARLCASGDAGLVLGAAGTAPDTQIANLQPEIDAIFGFDRFSEVAEAVEVSTSDALAPARKALTSGSPLSMRCTFELVKRVRGYDIRHALEMEHRFTTRAVADADIVEGVRALIIDKDRNPKWKHASWRDVSDAEVAHFFEPQDNPKLEF